VRTRTKRHVASGVFFDCPRARTVVSPEARHKSREGDVYLELRAVGNRKSPPGVAGNRMSGLKIGRSALSDVR